MPVRAPLCPFSRYSPTVVGMDLGYIHAPDPPRQVPDHIIDMLAAVIHVPEDPTLPPGSPELVRAVRDTARRHAERIWAEAVTMGAMWGLARNINTRVEVTAEQFEELKNGDLHPASRQ
jgi:hypothetical protein